MRSHLPKVLHPIANTSMLERVVNTASALSPAAIYVVYGYQGQKVKDTLSHLPVVWVEQTQQLGTGHAVLQAIPSIPRSHNVLILYADVPLMSASTLQEFINTTPPGAISVITATIQDPAELGRIVRNQQGQFLRIVEFKDATAEQRSIKEINSGLYAIPAHYLHDWLPQLSANNQQQEYYLTDILEMAVNHHVSVHTHAPTHPEEIMGVNDRVQLAYLERFFQRTEAEKLMRQGVTLMDPARLDIRGTVEVQGKDIIIDANVILEGCVSLGEGCNIGANTIIRDSFIGAHVDIKEHCVIEGAHIHDRAVVGPFARLRPNTILDPQARVGNFVEIKKSHIGTASKINHLSYVGDATVGNNVNIGAGTITCNYDGANKHQTVIHDGAFIGSGTQLVAPVSIGTNATIGAGSTITQDSPDHQLTLARSRQQTLPDWKRPQKKENKTCAE